MEHAAESEISVPADLIQDFRRLGFTEYEAKIYMQLLMESPATAYEIAKATGVPRPNTYNALESLAKRGAVLPVSENPVRYVAAPPDRHLNNLGRETMAICSTLVKELARLRAPADDPYVWNVKGEAAIFQKINTLISQSSRSICVKAAADVLRTYADALRTAADRGVDILIVLFGTDAEEFRFNDRCQVFLHEGNGVRMGTADNLFTITIDHSEVVTASTDQMTAFHTRNHAVVLMADTLIRHDYYMAEIYLRFGEQIDAAFGPHLKELRLRRFTEEQIRSFRERTGLN
jgi:sugar-specific transcriptional regulator TrmB